MQTQSALDEARKALTEKLLSGASEDSSDSVIPRLAPGLPVRASSYQEEVYLHAKFVAEIAPKAQIYNEPLTFHRSGPLDVVVLERALTEIVRRHEAWRTTFHEVNGEVMQVVHAPFPVDLAVVNLQALASDLREESALKAALENVQRPFDLGLLPLFRFTLVELADDQHRLIMNAHQIIVDGVSGFHVLLPEIAELYEAYSFGRTSPLADPAVQYRDYSAWEREYAEGSGAGDLEYWRNRLTDHKLFELPGDHAQPDKPSFKGAIEPFTVAAPTVNALKQLSYKANVTLFVSMLASFAVLLRERTGADDVTLGTLAQTRVRPELEKVLGYFLNPVALRLRPARYDDLGSLLRHTREVLLEALSHSTLPFRKVADGLCLTSEAGRNPVYRIQFSQEPPIQARSRGWDITFMDYESGAARLDLYLEYDDRPEGILGRLLYNSDLYERSTIRALIADYCTMLESIAVEGQMVVKAGTAQNSN